MRTRWTAYLTVGVLAEIFVTITGGWRWMPSVAMRTNTAVAQRHNPLAQLHMVTLHVGWALIDQHVARTTDGGQIWQALGPRIPSGAFVMLVGLDTHDVGTLIETGNVAPFTSQYEWTTNAGQTWHSVPVPWSRNSPPTAIQLLTPQDGWILTGVGPENLGNESAVLLQTTNGGASWVALSSSVFPGFPQRMKPGGLPYLFGKSGVTFRSRRVGWVTGGNAYPHEVVFDRTTNGGHTFAPQPLPAVDSQVVGATDPPVFTSPQTGWLPVITNRGRGFEHTTNGGQTWVPTPTLFKTGRRPISWSFVGAHDGWVLADDHLYRTTNSGHTWTPIARDRHLPHWTAIDFVTSTQGWATTTSLATPLWETTNGGVTWTPISPQLRLSKGRTARIKS